VAQPNSFPQLKEVLENEKKQMEKMDAMEKMLVKMASSLDKLEACDKPLPTPEEEEEVELVVEEEVKVRRGVLFISSEGNDIDLEEIAKSTDSKIEKVMTYRIEKDDSAPDPELHLRKMIQENMTEEHDFGIIVVGANDVDKVVQGAGQWKEVEQQSRQLTDIAMAAAEQFSADMFVSQRVPRHGGEPALAKLTTIGNSYLETMVTTAQCAKLHLVKQTNLGDPQLGQGYKDLYSNHKHLSDKGLKKLTRNLVSAVKEVFPVKEEVKAAKVGEEVKVKEVRMAPGVKQVKVKYQEKQPGGDRGGQFARPPPPNPKHPLHPFHPLHPPPPSYPPHHPPPYQRHPCRRWAAGPRSTGVPRSRSSSSTRGRGPSTPRAPRDPPGRPSGPPATAVTTATAVATTITSDRWVLY